MHMHTLICTPSFSHGLGETCKKIKSRGIEKAQDCSAVSTLLNGNLSCSLSCHFASLFLRFYRILLIEES